MARIDEQIAIAHAIILIAPNTALVLGEVRDMAIILLIAGVAKQRDADNLVLDFGAERLADDVVHDGRALRVAAGNDVGRRTGCGGLLEGFDAFFDGAVVGALGGQVGQQRGAVHDGVCLHVGDFLFEGRFETHAYDGAERSWFG